MRLARRMLAQGGMVADAERHYLYEPPARGAK